MRVKDKQIRRVMQDLEARPQREITEHDLVELLIAVADGSRRSPQQARSDLLAPGMTLNNQIELAKEGLSGKEKSDIKKILSSDLPMSPSVRVALEALLGQGSQPTVSKVKQLAQELAADGRLTTDDLVKILDNAYADGALSTAEVADLKSVQQSYADQLEGPASDRLSALLGMEDAAVQKLAHEVSRDGLIDGSDVDRLHDLVLQDGVAKPGEKASLQSVQIAAKTTANAKQGLEEAQLDTWPRMQEFIDDAAWGDHIDLDAVPVEFFKSRPFVREMGKLAGGAIELAPDIIKNDHKLVLELVKENPEVATYLPQPIENEEIFSAAVAGSGYAFQYGSVDLRSRRDLAETAIALYGGAIEFVEGELKTDRELMEKAIASSPEAISKLPEPFPRDRDLVLQAVGQNGNVLRDLDPAFFDDREVVLTAIQNGLGLQHLPEQFRSDREVVLPAVKASGWNLKHAAPELQDDAEIVAAAMANTGQAYEFASPRLQSDETLARQAVSEVPRLLAFAPDAVRDDMELVQGLLQRDVRAFQHASVRLRDDEDTAMLALAQNGKSLQYASQRLRDLRPVVERAISRSGYALEFASGRLKKNKALVRKAINKTAAAFNFADHSVQRDSAIALTALEKGGRWSSLDIPPELVAKRSFLEKALEYKPALLKAASDTIRQDREFVFKVVDKYPEALSYAHDSLRSDPDFVEPLIDLSGAYFPHIHSSLRGDADLLQKAMLDYPQALEYASDEMRGDRQLMAKAISLDGTALLYASQELQQDPQLALAAVKQDGSVLLRLSNELQQNTEIKLAAFMRSHRELKNAPESMLDDAFLAKLGRADPLALGSLPDARRSALLRANPDIKRAYQQQKSVLKRLNIEKPQRLGGPEIIAELVKNRTQPRDPDDHRPTAVFVLPKSDWNGAFEFSSVPELAESYRVLYYEAGTDDEFIDSVKDASRRDGEAEVMVIGGHASATQLRFGDDVAGQREKAYLDFSDQPDLRDVLHAAVAENGHVMIRGCSTGEGRAEGENLANMLHELVPEANIYAPTMPTNSNIVLDENRRFKGPGYRDGRHATYHIKPHS